MPPPAILVRRIDVLAAGVAEGLLSEKENLKRYIDCETTIGMDRKVKFAKDVYEIAKALLDESENY